MSNVQDTNRKSTPVNNNNTHIYTHDPRRPIQPTPPWPQLNLDTIIVSTSFSSFSSLLLKEGRQQVCIVLYVCMYIYYRSGKHKYLYWISRMDTGNCERDLGKFLWTIACLHVRRVHVDLTLLLQHVHFHFTTLCMFLVHLLLYKRNPGKDYIHLVWTYTDSPRLRQETDCLAGSLSNVQTVCKGRGWICFMVECGGTSSPIKA